MDVERDVESKEVLGRYRALLEGYRRSELFRGVSNKGYLTRGFCDGTFVG